jgi:hypothetical protein
VITGRGKVEHLLNAFHAEVIACLQGLQTAISLGVGHLILETDAQDVVQGIKTNNFLDSAIGHLLAEIKSLVRLNLFTFECVFKEVEPTMVLLMSWLD